jgi:hypothetical protein
MAVTFSTDCRRITAVMAKTEPTWAPIARIKDSSPILIEDTRALISELSSLVQNLQIEMSRDRCRLVSGRDKNLIQKIVLEPVQDLNLNLDYVLEVLGRYKRVEGRRRPESTLVDYCMSLSTSTDLGDTIALHALLLRSFEFRPDAMDVHRILEESIATYQEEKGPEHLRTSRELQEESIKSLAETYCWPLSDEYMDLARGLRSWRMDDEMPDPFEPSRTRLRTARNLRRALITPSTSTSM